MAFVGRAGIEKAQNFSGDVQRDHPKGNQEAFRNPGVIDSSWSMPSRRAAFDRLVGYKISPCSGRTCAAALSAGRVQSVALRLVVEREREIRAFVAKSTGASPPIFPAHNPPPSMRHCKSSGQESGIENEAQSTEIVKHLENACFIVDSVKKTEKKRNPVPPFITSKLQQEASRKLRFSVKKTMMLAQKLYEGIELGSEGSVGLITYMRTDSTRVSDDALADVRGYIGSSFGPDYLPEKPIFYRSKKDAQDAHEAIRPTSTAYNPEEIKHYLSPDEYKLYKLIWQRFLHRR
jgi:DNA topoisomerase-1